MEKPNLRFTKTTQVLDGKAYKWYQRKNGTYLEASVCCDCLLVHIVEMKPNKNYMRIKVWRDDKETKRLRKRKRRKR